MHDVKGDVLGAVADIGLSMASFGTQKFAGVVERELGKALGGVFGWLRKTADPPRTDAERVRVGKQFMDAAKKMAAK